MLIFTSGTSGDPKAVRCTHHKLASPGVIACRSFRARGADDVVYMAMPMFHSNAMMAAWTVALHARAGNCHATQVLRFGFSTRRSQVRNHVLQLRRKAVVLHRFHPRGAERAGLHLEDHVRQTRGSAPPPSPPSSGASTLASSTGSVPPRAAFRSPRHRFPGPAPSDCSRTASRSSIPRPERHARLQSSMPTAGSPTPTRQLVNWSMSPAPGTFAGVLQEPGKPTPSECATASTGVAIWRTPTSTVTFYFAGRSSGWLRVDGENIGAAPIERSLVGYPGFRAGVRVRSPRQRRRRPRHGVGDSGRRCRQLRPGSRSRIHRFPAGTRAEAEADLDPSVQ